MRFSLHLAPLVLTLVVSPAAASPVEEALRLRWHAPVGCPREADVVADALRLAPPSPAPHLDAEAWVESSGDGFHLRLATSRAGQPGERWISAASCEELAQATALVLATALGPPGETRVDASPRTPSGQTELGAGVTMRALVDVGSLPAPAIGARAALRGRFGPALVEAAATYWSDREARVGPPSDATARLGLLEGGARACFRAVRTAVEAGPCASAAFGSMHGAGGGLRNARAGSSLWAATFVGVEGSYRVVGPLALGAEISVGRALRTPGFTIESSSVVVHEPSAWPFRAGAGLELRLP